MAALSSTRRAFVVGLLLVCPLAARAQAPRALIGLVKDSAGHAISAAEVRARGNVLVARSDDSGRFRVAEMPVGARGVFVRRLGFAPKRARITVGSGTTDSVVIVLAAAAVELPPMSAVEEHDSLSHKVLADFWARRARGFGKFVTRDEIERRGGTNFVDLVRAVPSVSVRSAHGRPELRFSHSMTGDCPPQYWVDGIPLDHASADEFAPDNVEAIELYSSAATTPPQFNTQGRTCGTVVIWTRLPG